MNLSYDVSYSVAGLFICVILLVIVSLHYSSTNLINKRYKWFLISSIITIALDLGTVVTNDYASLFPNWLNMTLNGLYFLSATTVAVLFLYYCISVALVNSSPKTRSIFYMVNLGVLGVFLITLIINSFTGFYFFFDAQSVYSHGPAYFAVNSASILFVVESMILFIIKNKFFKKAQIVSIVLFYTFFFAAFILQLTTFPKILLTDFGIALGVLMLFFTIETPDYVKLVMTLNELNELKASLEIQVENRTQELNEEKESYEELTLETLSSLANVIDAKDHYTNGHSKRVAAYAKGIAETMGLSPMECEQIYFAGLIHDVGKIGINEAILTKPGKLDESEYRTIQSHSALGGDILKGIREFPLFEQVARSHHERVDGKGYPDKLVGDNIPFPARIVAVADAFDAMTSDRSYRKALSIQVAISELNRCKGTQFDAQVVEAFLKLNDRFGGDIVAHVDELAADVKTTHLKV